MSDKSPPKKLCLEPIQKVLDSDRFSNTSIQEACFQIVEPEINRIWGFISIDSTQRGPGLGGIRMVENLSSNEISRLAHVMTLKNSAACLPYGGAKAGIILKDNEFADNSELRNELMEKLADCLFDLPDYIPAPDMGTNEQDIQIIFDNHSQKLKNEHHSQGGSGRPVEKGGIPIDDWELTAHGLFSAIKTFESLDGKLDLSKSSFIVQGFGNVGAPIAKKLQQQGATLVGASDINIALYDPNGLDVNALNQIRSQPGGLKNYPLKVSKRFSSAKLDWLLEAPCDILIPSARPDAITAKNADRIQCRYVLQGANTPSSKPIEYYLYHRHKILSLTDFIVNSGGVMGCAVERKMNIDGAYANKVKETGTRKYVENLIEDSISKNVGEIYSRLTNNNDLIFRDHAWELGTERLQTKVVWL